MTTAVLVSSLSYKGRYRVSYTVAGFGPYVAMADAVDAFIAAAGPAWDSAMKASEISTNITKMLTTANAVLSTVYCTAGELRAAVRQAYKDASKADAVFLGGAIKDLNLSDTVLANIFGVSNPSAQLTAIKNRIASHQTQRDAILAETGT